MKTEWDERFLNLAEHIATWSKDRSRQVGAVIVNDDKRVISFGYNGFPSGVDDDVEERHQRPAKYDWTVHGEENAVINAARIGASTKDCTIYVNLFPCARCAGLIVNAGIKRVVCNKLPNFDDEKYGKEFKISQQKFDEVGIMVDFVNTRIFRIDVGSISDDDIEDYIRSIVARFKKINDNK